MRISDWSSDVCSSDLAADLGADILRAGAAASALGEHDSADHRDEEDEARALEYEEVAGVEDGTQEFDIGHVWLGGRGFGGNVDAAGVPGGHREDDLGEKNQRQQRSERQIFGKARAEFGEVDVEHHDDESSEEQTSEL